VHDKPGARGNTPLRQQAQRLGVGPQALNPHLEVILVRHRKNTKKRARKPVTAAELAVIITALGTLFTGLAALITALK